MHERSHTTGHGESHRPSSCRTGTKRASRAGSSASPRVNGGSSGSSPRSRPPPPLRFGFECGGAPEGPKPAHRLGASHFKSERSVGRSSSEIVTVWREVFGGNKSPVKPRRITSSFVTEETIASGQVVSFTMSEE